MSTKEKPIQPAKGKTAAEALVTGGAIAVALVLLNVLTCGSRARVDLTEWRIYSLSGASQALVSGMKERINVKGYFGNVPAEYVEKVNYIDMLLGEYADRSGGRIVYEKIDPWNKPDLQAELRKEGIVPMHLRTLKEDAFQEVPVYFQVVFSHLDKKETWLPQQGFTLEGVEYEFTSRIKRLAHGKKKVGVTTGFGEPPQAQALSADVIPGIKLGLWDLYDVQMVNWQSDPKSIDDVDVLIVNGPTQKVSDAAKLHLDQFVMRGKPVLFLVSGMTWQSGGGQQQIPGFENPDDPYVGMPADSGLGDLLETYGFKVNQDVILDVRNSGPMMIPPGSRSGMFVPRALAPYALALDRDEKSVLGGIDVVALPLASSLSLVGPLADGKGGEGTKVMRLLETAPTAWAKAEVMAITRELRIAPPEGEREGLLVAAAVSGTFKSLYADKPVPSGIELPALTPPPAEGEEAPPAPAGPAEPLKESAAHTRMIVVSAPSIAADTTLMDVVYVNGFHAVHNMVDWLAEDVELVAARSKKSERRIQVPEAADRTLIKFANVIGAPLLLLVFGFGYWRVRERKRRNIKL